MHARRGRLDEAVASLRWAVAELEAADVYPTLIVCAARVLDILGIADEAVTSAARRAAGVIQPLGTCGELDTRMGEFAGNLLGSGTWKPEDLYREDAARTDSVSGFYNYNIKLATWAGPRPPEVPVRNGRALHSVVDLPSGGSFPLWHTAENSSSWSTYG